MKRPFARYILGSMLMLSLAACGTADLPAAQNSAAPVAVASASADNQSMGNPKIGATDTILTIRAEGGHCIQGACWSEKQIKGDGSYTAADGTGTKKEGKLEAARVAELTQQIAAADFAQIKAQPFTGTCPIAFDGQEFTYTFQTVSGLETIASCKVGIDENSPLFKNIAELNEMMNQP